MAGQHKPMQQGHWTKNWNEVSDKPDSPQRVYLFRWKTQGKHPTSILKSHASCRWCIHKLSIMYNVEVWLERSQLTVIFRRHNESSREQSLGLGRLLACTLLHWKIMVKWHKWRRQRSSHSNVSPHLHPRIAEKIYELGYPISRPLFFPTSW